MITLDFHNTYVKVTGADKLELRLISDLLSFEPDGVEFARRNMPKYLQERWDGRKRLFDKRKSIFPAGLAPRVIELLQKKGIQYKMVDSRKQPTSTSKFSLPETLTPRDYQLEVRDLKRKYCRGITIMGTGAGKTITAALVIADKGLDTLFVTPDAGLREQTFKVFSGLFGDHMVCKNIDSDKPIIVSNIQALAKKTVTDLERFKVLMIDEFHHCFRGDTEILGPLSQNKKPRTIKRIYELVQKGFVPKVTSWDGKDWVSMPVVNAFKYKSPELLRVKIQDEEGEMHELYVTRKHKIHTPDGMKEIGSLFVGDEVSIGCKRKTSKQHLEKLNRSDEHRKAVAKGNRCRSEEVRSNQSKKIKRKMVLGEYNPYGRGRYGKGGCLTPTQERVMSLISEGEPEYAVTIGDGQRPYHYKIDVAIPHRRIGIEIDGTSHKNRQEADMRKNIRLRSLGWKVIRIQENCSKDTLSTLKKLVEMMSTT